MQEVEEGANRDREREIVVVDKLKRKSIKRTMAGSSTQYQTRPSFKERFPTNAVKETIRNVLQAELTGVEYAMENTPQQTAKITDDIKNQLKMLNLPRYKFMVQVVIGEMRGQGVQMGSRCFWDSNTDSQVSDTFVNDSLFAVATAYGVYHY